MSKAHCENEMSSSTDDARQLERQPVLLMSSWQLPASSRSAKLLALLQCLPVISAGIFRDIRPTAAGQRRFTGPTASTGASCFACRLVCQPCREPGGGGAEVRHLSTSVLLNFQTPEVADNHSIVKQILLVHLYCEATSDLSSCDWDASCDWDVSQGRDSLLLNAKHAGLTNLLGSAGCASSWRQSKQSSQTRGRRRPQRAAAPARPPQSALQSWTLCARSCSRPGAPGHPVCATPFLDRGRLESQCSVRQRNVHLRHALLKALFSPACEHN